MKKVIKGTITRTAATVTTLETKVVIFSNDSTICEEIKCSTLDAKSPGEITEDNDKLPPPEIEALHLMKIPLKILLVDPSGKSVWESQTRVPDKQSIQNMRTLSK
jgi:hypothetical protein